jgi:hypothetical protein
MASAALAAVVVDHLHQFRAQVAPDDGKLARLEHRLVHDELVGVDRTLHHRLAQSVARGEEDDVAKARLGVEREHDAGRALVAAHHALHAGRQCHLVVGEAVVHAIGDGPIVVERGEDLAHALEHGIGADHVEEGLLLAGERGLRQILGGRAGAHRHRDLAVAARQFAVMGAHRLFEVGRHARGGDPAADLAAGLGQRLDVLRVDLGQARGDALAQLVGAQELAEGVRRRGKPVGHADAARLELAEHLAQGGVLAAHAFDVPHAQLAQGNDQVLGLHQGSQRWMDRATGADRRARTKGVRRCVPACARIGGFYPGCSSLIDDFDLAPVLRPGHGAGGARRGLAVRADPGRVLRLRRHRHHGRDPGP